jgi:hypothetical protein
MDLRMPLLLATLVTMWMYLGPAVPTAPSLLSWMMRISMNTSRGFLLSGPIRILVLARPLRGRGRQPLGQSAQAYSRLVMPISTLF